LGRTILLRGALAAIAVAASLITVCANAADRLGEYNVDIRTTSVSGLSSGAAMAVQLDVAYSSIFRGAGIVAGPPYLCAHGSSTTAQDICMAAQQPIDVADLVNLTRKSADDGAIDPVANLRKQRIWLFSGGEDSTVRRPVVVDTEKYFKSFVTNSNVLGECWDRSSAKARRACTTAEHAMPTQGRGSRSCSIKRDPYINDCGFDAAGALLKWIYPDVRTKAAPAVRGKLLRFDQAEFIAIPALHGMSETGFVFVPESCRRQQPCRLHVALHGCSQNPSHRYFRGNELVTFDDTFARLAGYNEWADANRIIVLYPQAESIPPFPNPFGCWDWWGYTDDRYATRSGKQMTAIRSMIDRVATHR